MVRKTAKLTGNAGIWRDRGLTEQGAKFADEAMPLMLAALKAARVLDGENVAKAVYAEAFFQLVQIPRLDEEVQEKLRWKHP